MSQRKIEFVVYIGGIAGQYHWTKIKDHLRLITQHPSGNLGYVHPLSYVSGEGKSDPQFMAALVRLHKKSVARQLYHALEEKGFGGYAVRVALFECAKESEPQILEHNFGSPPLISQQGDSALWGDLGPQTEWHYAMQAVVGRYIIDADGVAAAVSNTLMPATPVAEVPVPCPWTRCLPLQHQAIDSKGQAATARAAAPPHGNVIDGTSSNASKVLSNPRGSAQGSMRQREPVIVNGSVYDDE